MDLRPDRKAFAHTKRSDSLTHSLSFAADADQFEAVVTDAYSNPRAKKMEGNKLFQLPRFAHFLL